MMTHSHDRIFAAVFPPPSDVEVPTPTATPVLGSSGFGEPFGGLHPSQKVHESSAAEQIKWDRAWHTATMFLALPAQPVKASQNGDHLEEKWMREASGEVCKALDYVLSENSRGRQIRKDSGKDDLLRWYFEEVVLEHYQQHAQPYLVKVLDHGLKYRSSRSNFWKDSRE